MDMLASIAAAILTQLQQPTLAFLIGGVLLAACGSKLTIPQPIYGFIVALLLLKIGIGAGISVRNADFVALAVPALGAAAVGIAIVLLGRVSLARLPGVKRPDALATAGLFGAVSASTLAAGMAVLDSNGIAYEGFIAALYPFMDLAALVTAIVLARLSLVRETAMSVNSDGTAAIGPGGSATAGLGEGTGDLLRSILVDTLRSPAISALIVGLGIGLFARAEGVYEGFYELLFRGLLSILMLIMGMEAWARLSELRKVAHVYVAYGLMAPFVHGLLGFAVGVAIHHATGFSPGGVILLAVMASSSSDISGPPTLRGALPEANPSAYVGTSTGLGTPVAILSIPLYVALAEWTIGL